MRIYLDNCCYNRPFDDQDQLAVRLETVTKLAVQLMMAAGSVEFAWSKALDYEISFNPFPKRRTAILWWKRLASVYVEMTDDIIGRGEKIERLGVRHKDALHLASAERANCEVFLTTDKGILKKVTQLGTMRVLNPVQFFTEVGNDSGYGFRQ